jgi:hypothetical protein
METEQGWKFPSVKIIYFLVKADIRDGEAEYPESFIVKAKDLDEADVIAEKIKDETLGYNDYREIRIRGIEEITLVEAKIIEKLGLSYVSN